MDRHFIPWCTEHVLYREVGLAVSGVPMWTHVVIYNVTRMSTSRGSRVSTGNGVYRNTMISGLLITWYYIATQYTVSIYPPIPTAIPFTVVIIINNFHNTDSYHTITLTRIDSLI